VTRVQLFAHGARLDLFLGAWCFLVLSFVVVCRVRPYCAPPPGGSSSGKIFSCRSISGGVAGSASVVVGGCATTPEGSLGARWSAVSVVHPTARRACHRYFCANASCRRDSIEVKFCRSLRVSSFAPADLPPGHRPPSHGVTNKTKKKTISKKCTGLTTTSDTKIVNADEPAVNVNTSEATQPNYVRYPKQKPAQNTSVTSQSKKRRLDLCFQLCPAAQ